jgi:ATP synthase protein I
MAGADEEPGRDKSDHDTENIRRRLTDLEGKLGRLRDRQSGTSSQADAEERGAAFGNALRLSTELIAGVAVGGVIGWALDSWLGTEPLFMVVFLFLGAAAGIVNVIRSAKDMQAKALKSHLPPDASDNEDE